jgi:hypothetical protein
LFSPREPFSPVADTSVTGVFNSTPNRQGPAYLTARFLFQRIWEGAGNKLVAMKPLCLARETQLKHSVSYHPKKA